MDLATNPGDQTGPLLRYGRVWLSQHMDQIMNKL